MPRWKQNIKSDNTPRTIPPPKCPNCGEYLEDLDYEGTGSYSTYFTCYRVDSWDEIDGRYIPGDVEIDNESEGDYDYEWERILCPNCGEEVDLSEIGVDRRCL